MGTDLLLAMAKEPGASLAAQRHGERLRLEEPLPVGESDVWLRTGVSDPLPVRLRVEARGRDAVIIDGLHARDRASEGREACGDVPVPRLVVWG